MRYVRPVPERSERRPWEPILAHPILSSVLGGIILAAIVAGWNAIDPFSSGRSSPARGGPGWGPNRPIYRCRAPRDCQGADHVTFDSYVNAPNYGDERAFLDAKPATTKRSGGFLDHLTVSPGEDVLVRAYVNNAASAYRTSPGANVAHGTKMRVAFSASPAKIQPVVARISADNAVPPVVWDGLSLASKKPVLVRYQFGSARWWTRRLGREIPISDDLISDGTAIGSRALDGVYGSDFADGGLLTFHLLVERAPSTR
jgi:hypothetical protein